MSRPTQVTTNYSNIDATYPVAGVDNSTQGFRDNFSYIKNGINSLETAVNLLIENSIVKDDDTNVYNAVVDHLFAVNMNPVILANSTQTPTPGNYQINASLGNYQQITLSGDTNITGIGNWPTHTFSGSSVFAGFETSVIIAVRSSLTDSTAVYLDWPTGTAKDVANLKYKSTMPTTIAILADEVHFFKIRSITAGSGESFVEYLGVFA